MSRWWGERGWLLVDGEGVQLRPAGASQATRVRGSLGEALDGLVELGGGGLPGRGSGCNVVLGDELVRHLVVRWPDGLRGRVERQAFVSHRLRETHGVSAPDWRIVVEGVVTDMPAIACAAPVSLLEQVFAWGGRNGWRIDSVRSEYIAAFNQFRRRLGDRQGAFSLASSRAWTVGTWRDGEWHSLRTRVGIEQGEAGQAVLAMFGAAVVDSGSGVLYGVGAGACPVPDGWSVRMLGSAPWQ